MQNALGESVRSTSDTYVHILADPRLFEVDLDDKAVLASEAS